MKKYIAILSLLFAFMVMPASATIMYPVDNSETAARTATIDAFLTESQTFPVRYWFNGEEFCAEGNTRGIPIIEMRYLYELELELKRLKKEQHGHFIDSKTSPGVVAMAQIDYQNIVGNLARDDAGRLDVDARDTAIALAVIRYSKDRPLSAVEDVASLGGHYLVLPTGWDADSSDVQAVEYPIGNVPPNYLGGNWRNNTPTGVQIGIPSSLTTGELVRMTYTKPHVLEGEIDTLPVRDREAVASYAAAILFDQLAATYSGDTDSTIMADGVNHGDKSGRFASRANKLRQRYFDELGIDPKRLVAASVTVDLDMHSSLGRDRLTHPARLR